MSNRSRLTHRPAARRRRSGTTLRIALACLIATPVVLSVPPAPAAAAPKCGPKGGAAPTQRPWPLRRLDPQGVWPLTRGDGVLVAVIDSGVAANHPILKNRVKPGRDIGVPNRSGQCDQVGHGTLIAGIIAGRDGTDVPFSGVAPDARILPIRVLQGKRSQDQELPGRIAQAIRYAVDQGADVVNLSLQTFSTPALKAAVEYAAKKDVVLVAAGGNSPGGGQQRDEPAYPAGYKSVIAVAGVNQQGGHVDTSVKGSYVDVAAPGEFIEGPAPGGGYQTLPDGGTSFAAAYVSGVVALMRAYNPKWSASNIAYRLTRTADSPPEERNDLVGYGVVNIHRAITALVGTGPGRPLPPFNPAPTPPDPLATAKLAATWAAAGAILLAVLVLTAAPIIRNGRRRRWRPGRINQAPATVATGPQQPDQDTEMAQYGMVADMRAST